MKEVKIQLIKSLESLGMKTELKRVSQEVFPVKKPKTTAKATVKSKAVAKPKTTAKTKLTAKDRSAMNKFVKALEDLD